MGTGGERYGAGRPGWRRKCEQTYSLDIRRLHQRQRLEPHLTYSWAWSRGGERSGEIAVYVNDQGNGLTLRYQWTPYGYEARSIACIASIVRTRCNYGGFRPWFVCPDCGRRCAVLYGVSRHGNFACRVCQRLVYSSEAESPLDRLWRKQRKIESRLIEGEIKPKAMRWRTYERLIDRINEIEEEKDAHFLIRLMPMLRRSGI